jgi:hypothetical protein
MQSKRKKLWNTINIKERLEVISWPEKAEQTADICHNVTFPHNSVRTVRGNSEGIKELKSETKLFV